MLTVKQILEAKGCEVWSVEEGTTVYEALHFMASKDIGAVLVMRGTRMTGILSERDYARKVVLEGRSSRATLVAEIMSREVVHVAPHDTVNTCMALMTEHKVRHLPVLDEGRVVGMVSIGDLVKSIIAEQEFVIEQMTNYISGALA